MLDGGAQVTNGGVTLVDERRLVTVLFADLVGFTGRGSRAFEELGALRFVARTS